MEELQTQVAYVGAFLFGMVVVALHAQKLYSQRTSPLGIEKPLVSFGVIPIAILSSKYSYIRGLVFYLSVAEIVFLILSFSTVILELSLSAVGRAEMAGALSGGLQVNPIVPILASSVVIAASQLRPFSEVELAIRKMAHRIAGVPGALEEIQSNVKSFKVIISKDEDKEIRNSEIFSHAKKRANMFVAKLDNQKHLHDYEIDNLRNTLIWIYCLYQWTLGYHGRSIWTARSSEHIVDLYESLGLEYIRIEDEIRSIMAMPKEENELAMDGIAIGKWRDVADACVKLENNLITVLSLLLNDRPELKFNDYPLLQRVSRDALRRSAIKELNVLGMSLIVSSFIAIFLLAFYQYGTDQLKNSLRSEPALVYSNFPMKPVSESASPITQALSQWWSSGAISLENRSVAQSQILNTIASRSSDLHNAIRDFLPHLLFFSVSAFTTLLVSRARHEDGRWPRRSTGEPPLVSTYLINGIVAYLIAMPAYLILEFCRLVLLPSIRLDVDIFTDTNLVVFTDYLGTILLTPLICFVCAWFVFQKFESHLAGSESESNREKEDNRRKVDSVENPVTGSMPENNSINEDSRKKVNSVVIPVIITLVFYILIKIYRQGFSTGWEVQDAIFQILIAYSSLFYVFGHFARSYENSFRPKKPSNRSSTSPDDNDEGLLLVNPKSTKSLPPTEEAR